MEATYWYSLYAHMMILLVVLLGTILAVPAGSFAGDFRPLFMALVVLNILMCIGTLIWMWHARQTAAEQRARVEWGLANDEEPYLLRPVYVIPFPLTILWGAFMMTAFFNAA